MRLKAAKVRLVPAAGMTAFALVAGFYSYGTSPGTLASLYSTLGDLAGVSVGLALPALEAIRARRAMHMLRLERLRKTVTLVNVGRGFADQANAALCRGACDGSYFQRTYNHSQIEHAFLLINQIEPALSTRHADDVVANVRRDLRTFFALLHTAASEFRDFQAVSERVIASLRASYGNVAHDIDCLETECQRLEEKIDFWHIARKV